MNDAFIDSSQIAHQFLARATLGILEAAGDIRYNARCGEKPALIEEGGTFLAKGKQARRAEPALIAIQKDAGKQKAFATRSRRLSCQLSCQLLER